MENVAKVNVFDLASELAHKAACDNMLKLNQIGEEADMFNGEVYTDEAQNIFDRWNNYYAELISNYSVN